MSFETQRTSSGTYLIWQSRSPFQVRVKIMMNTLNEQQNDSAEESTLSR